jgi:hypothetical protein
MSWIDGAARRGTHLALGRVGNAPEICWIVQ